MKNKCRGFLFFAIIFAAFVGFSGFQNKTMASVGLKIQPIKVSHTIEPGDSVQGTIILTNESESVVKIKTKVEDFIPLAGSYDIQFVGRAEGVTTVRDWITFDAPESFIFQKNESKEIIYIIKAPQDAEPGSHFGVILFKANQIDQGAGALKISTEVGMLVFVTVPGNFLQKGRILDFKGPKFVQKGPVDFTMNFENTGTVHFEPKGKIKISNIFGSEVGEVPIEGQVVLPTGARDLKINWPVGFLLGFYKAKASVFDGEGNELTSQTISFFAFPVWYIASFFGAVILIYFGLKFLRRKVKFSMEIRK